MKKNGFTLVELIATIALIAVLATVILINMTGIKTNQDDVSSSRYKKIIEDAACTYIDMAERSGEGGARQFCKNCCHSDNCSCINNEHINPCKITLRTLIEEGLIDSDKKNIETGNTAYDEQDSVYVTVWWKSDGTNYVKNCTFKK